MHVQQLHKLSCEHMSIAASKFNFYCEIPGAFCSKHLATAAPKMDQPQNSWQNFKKGMMVLRHKAPSLTIVRRKQICVQTVRNNEERARTIFPPKGADVRENIIKIALLRAALIAIGRCPVKCFAMKRKKKASCLPESKYNRMQKI